MNNKTREKLLKRLSKGDMVDIFGLIAVAKTVVNYPSVRYFSGNQVDENMYCIRCYDRNNDYICKVYYWDKYANQDNEDIVVLKELA